MLMDLLCYDDSRMQELLWQLYFLCFGDIAEAICYGMNWLMSRLFSVRNLHDICVGYIA